tara:strand:+ start:56 stop:343 length:288 start_codon:yes stop_codon:yes gene_type:complete
MPRLNGTIATKKCWRVIIKQGINILHNEDYTTLKVASQELGLTYSQLVELGPNGRKQKKISNFKFHPHIEVIKLCYENKIVEPDIHITEPTQIIV